MAKAQGTKKPKAKATVKATAKSRAGAKKPARAKKPAVKAQPAAGAATGRDAMIEAIVEVARELDDAGLELLLNQAKVVKTKGQIERFNRELNQAAAKASAARRKAATPDYDVTVERTKDDFFIIQLDTARVFFNLSEMRQITALCHRSPDAGTGSRRLYAWFQKERNDLLVDADIRSDRDPYLRKLYELIVSTYKVKG